MSSPELDLHRPLSPHTTVATLYSHEISIMDDQLTNPKDRSHMKKNKNKISDAQDKVSKRASRSPGFRGLSVAASWITHRQ